MEAIESSEEDLRAIASLIERIVSRNQDATGEEMRSLGITWELVLAAGKELKALRKRKQFYARTSN
jgi:hypothetical protein